MPIRGHASGHPHHCPMPAHKMWGAWRAGSIISHPRDYSRPIACNSLSQPSHLDETRQRWLRVGLRMFLPYLNPQNHSRKRRNQAVTQSQKSQTNNTNKESPNNSRIISRSSQQYLFLFNLETSVIVQSIKNIDCPLKYGKEHFLYTY